MKERVVSRKKVPLGTHERFEILVKQLANKGNISEAPAMMGAMAGKKFGKSRFNDMRVGTAGRTLA